jgi:hypothetical protein
MLNDEEPLIRLWMIISYEKKEENLKAPAWRGSKPKIEFEHTKEGEIQCKLLVRCHLKNLIKFELRLTRVFHMFSLENLNKVR